MARQKETVTIGADVARSCLVILKAEEARREAEQPFEDLLECEFDARMSHAEDAVELTEKLKARSCLRCHILLLEMALEA